MPDSKTYRKLKIFLASPSDVAKEREYVRDVVNELNKSGSGVADEKGLHFEVIGYDTHVSPDMGRPQGVTFDQLPPKDWDLFIGILWQRFGSPTGAIDPQTGKEFQSGSIEEFTCAYELWQQHGAPRIFFYRCVRAPEAANIVELQTKLAQLQPINDFFAQFGPNADHPGFYRTYQTPEEFKDFVRQDLTKFVLEYQTAPQAQIATPVAPLPAPRESDTTLQRRYLQNLQRYCDLLPLAAVDEKADSSSGSRLTLSQVYINLNTTDFVDENGKLVTHELRGAQRERAPDEKEKLQPYTALQAATQHAALVLLGDPGSGKSSFLNHLMFMLAAKQLQHDYALPETWPHGALLPVRVLLRELAVSLQKQGAKNFINLNGEARRREFSRVLHEHVAEHLVEYDAQDFAPALKTALANGQCLLVFDGLDEAPTPQRPLVRLAVEEFCAAHPGNRYLLTCRIRSYEGNACLGSFKTVTLAPFDDAQVGGFIEHWYDALPQKFTADQATAKKADLREAVQRLPADMVRNPLLLTTLANMHTNSLELPRQRIKLYKNASALLLQRWHAHKAGKVSLIEALGLQSDREIYRALWELGYFAQKSERGQAAADIPETEAANILTKHFAALAKPLVAAGEFLDFVDQTAGLLIGKGGAAGNVYAFPHRTFQEYFAGCHLAKGSRDFKRALRGLLAEGDYWRLTAQLGMEEFLYNDTNEGPAMDAAYSLCTLPEPLPEDTPAWRGALWAGHFALEIGVSRIAQDDLPEGGPAFLERVRQRLLRIVEKNLLPPLEHADAGFVLGQLGDPREGVCTLPPVWVELEGGKFTMGSNDGESDERPAHEVEVSPFKISKYPITNAQFEMFMNAGGYHEQKWWSEEGWEYRQKENWEQPRLWENDDFNLPNQPVVGVSWFEAEAFCKWLGEQGANGKGQNARVRLPTEAEWEFAARGKEGRKFPWGDDAPKPEHANFDQTQINRPTAVGGYAKGATPEGLFDLAGNVWEWCLDFYDEKYYAACKKKGVVKNPLCTQESWGRVLRGGAYYSDATGLRGSRRLRDVPVHWVDFYGFRVCACES